jgi:hypothetical protein
MTLTPIMGSLPPVEPGFLSQYLTLTLVLGLALLQLLGYLRKPKSAPPPETAAVAGEMHERLAAPERYVPRELCLTMHQSTDDRIRRLEMAEQAFRTELAAIRAEMKHDRESMQGLIRDEMGKVHRRLDDVLVAVAELKVSRDGRGGLGA